MKKFLLTGAEYGFPTRTLVAQALRPTINKWDFMKLNFFFNSKRYHHVREETAYRTGKYNFTSCTSERKLVSEICTENIELNTKDGERTLTLKMEYRTK